MHPKVNGAQLDRSRKCRTEFYKLEQLNVLITRRMGQVLATRARKCVGYCPLFPPPSALITLDVARRSLSVLSNAVCEQNLGVENPLEQLRKSSALVNTISSSSVNSNPGVRMGSYSTCPTIYPDSRYIGQSCSLVET